VRDGIVHEPERQRGVTAMRTGEKSRLAKRFAYIAFRMI